MVVRAGSGPRILLIHGSAADHTTWSIQLVNPPEGFEVFAYERYPAATVEEGAAQAASMIESSALVVGSSFGAVVALELVRSRPELVTGALLIEPPMAADDSTSPAPQP